MINQTQVLVETKIVDMEDSKLLIVHITKSDILPSPSSTCCTWSRNNKEKEERNKSPWQSLVWTKAHATPSIILVSNHITLQEITSLFTITLYQLIINH